MPNTDDEVTFWGELGGQRPSSKHVDDAIVASMRTEANTVICRYCRSTIGADCINVFTGNPLKGLPCHPIRLTDARKAAQWI